MKRKIIFLFVLVFSLHVTLYAQVDTVLNRYKQYLFQTEHPTDISQLMNSLNKQGRWEDIPYYKDTSRAFWQTMQHLKRSQELAIAWANPKSTWYHQDTLGRAISAALDQWLFRRYYNPNWWYNEIGVPQYMRNIIILLRPHLSSYEHRRSLEELDQYRIMGTGTNLIWSADLGFHYGALTNDTVLMRHCIDIILQEIKITTGSGIQPDYSFHMHGNRLQIFSYGTDFLSECLKLAIECHDTRWAFPKEKIDLLVNFVLKGWQWMCRGVNTVPGTLDRTVSRIDALHAADIRSLIPQLVTLCPDKATELKAIAARQNGTGKPLIGFRYFPYSDFAADQCKNFSFFLKTVSTRTLLSESINSENLKGHLLNSGDAYLILDGEEYFNLMPVWNWNALPGVTGFQGAEKIIRKPFIGSVSDSKSGLTAMDYDMEGTDAIKHIYAHKIWACHQNLVVCLIAGLTADKADENIFTTLDQCRWRGAVTINKSSNIMKQGNHIVQNVRWIHHSKFAYIPLKPATIHLFLDTASGTWSSINAAESDTLVTDSVFMPILIHGKKSQNLSTGYILAYCPTAKQAAKLSDKPTWKILCNDTICQGVAFADEVRMVAFFSSGSCKISKQMNLRVNKPCTVILEGNKLYISDPAHSGETVEVNWNGKAMDIPLPKDGTTIEKLLHK